MKISSRTEGDVLVHEFKGGLEGGPDTYAIKDQIKEALEAGQRKFLFNLAKVDFVNSTGIGIMTSTYSTISSAGGELKLCSANSKVNKIMMVTKLLEVFDSYEDEASAIAAFA
jgi:anti-sigma B factor antagonist